VDIWILNHYATPLDGIGGTRHAVLAKYLGEHGHNVTIFASAFLHRLGKSVKLPAGRLYADRKYDSVRFRFIKTTPYNSNSVQRFVNMLSYRHNICRALDGLDKPDVIIGSCVHLHAADAALRLANRFCVPFIFEVRDVWPESLVDVGAISRVHPIYWYMRRMELRLYRNASRVIVLLPGMASYLQAYGVLPDHVWNLPNGIDPSLYPEMRPAPEKDPFIISFFGAHGPANALSTIVDAAALLQSTPEGQGVLFRLIGDGTEKNLLQNRAHALKLRNIEFLPPVPKGELSGFAQQSNAFVFHLRAMAVLEKYGISANKLFDYLMAARPIIFACNSYNNPVEAAKAGLTVLPQDSAALAEAVRRLRSLSVEERWTMGQNGRSWVLEHHDLRKLVLRLETELLILLQNS